MPSLCIRESDKIDLVNIPSVPLLMTKRGVTNDKCNDQSFRNLWPWKPRIAYRKPISYSKLRNVTVFVRSIGVRLWVSLFRWESNLEPTRQGPSVGKNDKPHTPPLMKINYRDKSYYHHTQKSPWSDWLYTSAIDLLKRAKSLRTRWSFCCVWLIPMTFMTWLILMKMSINNQGKVQISWYFQVIIILTCKQT